MQDVKNKLAMFNALRCANLAATDLKLLAKRCPQHPDMARFMFSPERNADDILFSLLDHATKDEILENRTENEQGEIDENGDDGHNQTEGEGEQTADGNNDETSEGQSSESENETEVEGDEEDMPTETDGEQPATATCVENGSEQTDEHQAVPQDKVPKAKDAKKK